jgi:hypothetical protein
VLDGTISDILLSTMFVGLRVCYFFCQTWIHLGSLWTERVSLGLPIFQTLNSLKSRIPCWLVYRHGCFIQLSETAVVSTCHFNFATFTFLHNDSTNDTAVLVGVQHHLEYGMMLHWIRPSRFSPAWRTMCMLVAFLPHSIQMSQPPTRAHAQETPRYMPAPSIISPPGSCKSNPSVLRSAADLPLTMVMFIQFAHRILAISQGELPFFSPAWMHAGCVGASRQAARGASAGAAGGGDAEGRLLPIQPGPEHRRHRADRVLLQGGRRRRRQQRLPRAEGVLGEGARPLLPARRTADDQRRGEAGRRLHGRRRRLRGGRGGLRYGGHRRRHRARSVGARQACLQRPRRQEHTRDASPCSPGTSGRTQPRFIFVTLAVYLDRVQFNMSSSLLITGLF